MLAAIPQKTGNLTFVYGAVAILSVMLVVCYLLWEKKKEHNFFLLFICVAVANCGYFLQSVSDTLSGALWANRISYLGSAYLALLLLLIIMDVCQCKHRKWVNISLVSISTTAFLLAASADLFGLYYKAVDLVTVNGMTRLVKEYGPLHTLYPVYLLSYFIAMVVIITQSFRKKTLSSPKYAVFLAAAVFLNIGVWAVEQIIYVEFEFLCVSYVVTEIMLLLIYGMLRDYGIVQPSGQIISVQMLAQLNTQRISAGQLPSGMEDMFRSFAEKVRTLSPAERRILNYYIDGHDTADIPDLAFISIHTVKKHNRSIYQKLEVASRDELMLYIELFRCCDRLEELTGKQAEIE